MEAVLVTGGAGYIGSHVCKALASAGYQPVCFDDLSTGHEWAVRWGPLERGDILDSDRLADALRLHGIRCVAHLAARILAGEGESKAAEYERINVDGTRSVLRAMAAAGADRLVHSSTCAIYGEPARMPIDEGAALSPVSVYGRTKLAAEAVIFDAQRDPTLRAVALRYFNAAGADAGGEIGEWHEPETHLIPLVLMALRDGGDVELYGNDYATPDGTCVRDYLHVSDIAQAHLCALDHLRAGGDDLAVNLGTGHGASVREVITVCERVTQRRLRVRQRARRPGDPAQLYADSALARSVLGWQPAHGSLDEIVHSAWQWLQRAPLATAPARKRDGLSDRT